MDSNPCHQSDWCLNPIKPRGGGLNQPSLEVFLLCIFINGICDFQTFWLLVFFFLIIKKWYFEEIEFVPGGQHRSFWKTVNIKIQTRPYKSYTRHGKCILDYCYGLFFMLFLMNNILCNFTAHAQFFLPHFMLTSAFLLDPYAIENIFTITFSDPAHVFYSTKLPLQVKQLKYMK